MHAPSLTTTRCLTCNKRLGLGNCIQCTSFAMGVKTERRKWRTLTEELEDLERTDPKVREGYKEAGWQQPRQFNHVAVRAHDPREIADFYQEVFELFEVREPPLGDAVCLSDGTVRLLVQPTSNNSYMSMRQGLDHIGYKVESIEQTKTDLAELANSVPASAPRDIAGGIFGHLTKRDMDGCKIGQFATSDPDGVLLDFSEA